MRNPENFILLASIGLLFLALLGTQPPEKASIHKISPTHLGEKIRVSGTVENYSSFENTVFLTFSGENSSIPVVIFSSSQTFPEGEELLIEGRLTMYEGKMEIIADEIKRTS